MTPTCAHCRFGHLVPQDIKVRQCWGGPPQLMLQSKNGAKSASFIRPIVGATDDACALFQLRVVASAQPDINVSVGEA